MTPDRDGAEFRSSDSNLWALVVSFFALAAGVALLLELVPVWLLVALVLAGVAVMLIAILGRWE